ncbi:hypothetical protein BaRGS_00031809 [Batillaria attramentaria]|uniref:Transmembrane protein 184C n=1 Tax=Batillaria attramentaria TaxID=370345 RepID=A0ABD0JQP1_9CAEN
MDFLRRWRQWIRPLCFTLYFICLLIALPLCIIELNRTGAPDHVQAWFIGGVFVMLALPISFWGILQHLVYFTRPNLQRHIIRVLWMVPIYAMNAWFALRFPSAAIYLDTARECYEAYVIYNFMRYLLNFLHDEHPDLEQLLENKPRVKHIIPFCCLPAWPSGRVFLNRCKHGVLQYTVVRPAMTVIAFLTELAGKYDEGDFNFSSSWSYIVVINNVSQIWAMYCLVLFYKGTKEELAPLKPVPKFLCVKAVVFVSFWQSTLIAALAKLDVIPKNGTWVFYHDVNEVATGLQDFLICIEMFLAAIAHYYSFSHRPYIDMAADQRNCCESFFSMWDVRDVRDDVMDHARYISKGVQKLSRGKLNSGTSERTPLLASPDTPVMVNRDSSSALTSTPSTPPVVVEPRLLAPGNYDTLSISETDWERSTETFHVKSETPSMNNYIEFSASAEVTAPERHEQNGEASDGCVVDTQTEERRNEDGDRGQTVAGTACQDSNVTDTLRRDACADLQESDDSNTVRA